MIPTAGTDMDPLGECFSVFQFSNFLSLLLLLVPSTIMEIMMEIPALSFFFQKRNHFMFVSNHFSCVVIAQIVGLAVHLFQVPRVARHCLPCSSKEACHFLARKNPFFLLSLSPLSLSIAFHPLAF
jgi:hypothetical protein